LASREQPCDVASRDAVSAHDAGDNRVIQHLAEGQFSLLARFGSLLAKNRVHGNLQKQARSALEHDLLNESEQSSNFCAPPILPFVANVYIIDRLYNKWPKVDLSTSPREAFGGLPERGAQYHSGKWGPLPPTYQF
jgi:hypothetical protein